MAPGFSRLQLAAALLEYDNDLNNPDTPYRSAHESAIFAHLRRNTGTRPTVTSHRNSHLNVSVEEAGSTLAENRNSTSDNTKYRASRGSIDALRNPFGADESLVEYENEGEEELEVDLASWGLDAFMPKDRASRTGKGKAKSPALATSYPMSSVPSHQPFTSNDAVVTVPRRALGASRSMSVGGNLEYFGTEGAILDKQSSLQTDNRHRSMGATFDLTTNLPQLPIQRRRAASHTPIHTSVTSPQAIPFPTKSANPPSLYANEDVNVSRSLTTGPSDSLLHQRVLSTASTDSKMILQEADRRSRTISNATMLLADDNPFSLRPPSRASRFDPKAAAHARTISNASMGSRMLLENDGVSVVTDPIQLERERRYSTTLDLLRPKVLVMPSPLQSAPAPPPSPNDKLRDGFMLSTDGTPLPPGARSARRSSMTLSVIEAPPVASNSFTPNPLTSLSLSQLTFRDTLPGGTQRHSTYMDRSLPRATQDGEQANIEVTGPPEEGHVPASPGLEYPSNPHRPAGKLFGKSLIDDIESRKAQMRSKQRVFTGDERPSMMARGLQRSSTLIDPAALQKRPPVLRTSSYEPQTAQTLARHNSVNSKPLLNFDDDDKVPRSNLSPPNLSNSRSVFGVDTLWEREMIKLREIEAQEKHEAEERRKREEAEENKKKKRRKKQKPKANATADIDSPPLTEAEQAGVSVEPPMLPDIQWAVRRPPQVPDDESESDDSEDAGPSRMPVSGTSWHAGSSDEEAGPRRTTGTGPRYLDKRQRRPSEPVDNNSDDDLPLSVAVNRAAQQATLSRRADSDDEEEPLSALLQKKQLNTRDSSLHSNRGQDEDDDDQPLGLRVSRFGAHNQGDPGEDDDERPLAYHPEQQRRTQTQMMAQQQHQQQLMLQAQMRSNMFFGTPSLMGPQFGPQFFGPTMMPMMVQPPMQAPPLPALHDEARYGRVDKWRHDVAVEGDA
ncbi:hypothetical protein L208DRAFT_1274738 [Tricholoma matsutake]|nr:hypothetical protein L208DRAFT_1274738 [Tricholoma matsutake 945]